MGTGVVHGDIKFTEADIERIMPLLEHNSNKEVYRIFMNIHGTNIKHCEVEDFMTAVRRHVNKRTSKNK